MTNEEIAAYLADNYGRNNYVLMTLVSCAMILGGWVQEHEDADLPIKIVSDTLNLVRENLSEEEVGAVAMMYAEIARLTDDEERAE